ncbi:MAG: hypothetical protein Q8933_08695 [Bacteroidota bacterium]|nr:hypothetical protein [Bacteroidota bacterium]MDP4191283.1 hypothetical protein [Bacteroidota bacterium]MDP4195628.1 hypothetical protein [Bacteroidota bacterium]
MNTGQLLLTLGGMFLLSMVILRTNTTFLSTGNVMYNTKFGVLATSLGTSMIEEANSKAFDAATDTNSVSSLTSLTSPSGLGPAWGEVYPNFNDFDDYNNYTRIDSTMPSAVFKITCKVGYVLPTNPDVFVNQKTWNKRILVTVTSPSMNDTVRMSSVFSYWFFR